MPEPSASGDDLLSVTSPGGGQLVAVDATRSGFGVRTDSAASWAASTAGCGMVVRPGGGTATPPSSLSG